MASVVSKDAFGISRLYWRIRIPGLDVADYLLDFHLLGIPLLEMAHSGASLFSLFSIFFDSLCTSWKVKSIGSSNILAPNNTGFNDGFTTQLSNVSISGTFYLVWGLVHQLYLVIKAGLH